MRRNDVGEMFGAGAEEYDRARRALVPDFDGFYGAVFELVSHARDAEVGVLDLGAGTGLLSAMVAERFPRATLTLVDLSGDMLDVARRRFAGDDRFRFFVADYVEEPFRGRYDLVVSALSIHHLEDRDKQALFRKVYGALAPGGVFVNADQTLGASPYLEERYHERWLREVREAGVREEDLRASLERIKQDKNATLRAQLAWLERAGFEAVDCAYKRGRFAVYGGSKPEDGRSEG